MKPERRSTVARAAICQSSSMEVVDSFPRARTECDHASVANRSRLLIKWFADPESEFTGSAGLVYSPASRNAIPVGITGDAALHTERRQRCAVEGDCLDK